MNDVLPIKSVKKINDIRRMLKEKGKIRQLVLFSIGINSALRISDLLSIQVKHVFTE
jgi:integrase